ncbi:MAG: 30S ribosomal protein S20 [Cetobacterium sp.]|uniref:30S ribosomal protein S20 n=1 Tax=unclassified Cetobacterium TaxID=2630983 RepID=UPI00163D1F49|nr:30S ribosomal protein S20 [Cetobacterium sp. 2A]MBC2855810.1 30S ribosomal protein S20 [Cetobacterium sp. 2A]
MAHSKSAKKRILVAERNRERNQAVKSRVKTMSKKVLATVETKDIDAANAALSIAYKELDKAVSKGVLKKNTASRKKARLAAKVIAL